MARIFKFIIRNGCLQIRRAKWLSRLSNSCLIWDKTTEKSENQNQAVFFNGQLFSLQSVSYEGITRRAQEQISSIPHGTRLECFDIYTYDRMRILSSEIKRLITENRMVSLQLGSGAILSKKKLRNMIPWI